MNRTSNSSALTLAVISFAVAAACAQQPFDRQPPPPQPTQFGSDQALLRGPIHEAFVEPYVPDPPPGLEVPQLPPGDLREIPPDVRPTDDNVHWIPGYWGWDDQGFVWVTGCWRDPPPQMRWVPGYWTRADAVRWVAGFWLRDDVNELAYVPQPPASKDRGPVGDAPDENHFWVPGVWLFQERDFVWREGFWAEANPDFVWTPAQYHWSPRGYVFVDGYWDYPPEERGMLFAPILPPPARQLVYRPSIVIDASSVLAHFFVRPNYSHYYFGDYYDSSFRRSGIQSWVSYRTFDPLQVFYRYTRPMAYRTIVQRHDYFDSHPDWRPPHHWRDFGQYVRGVNDRDGVGIHFAQTLTDKVHSARDGRLATVSKEVHERHVRANDFYREITARRAQGELGKDKSGGQQTIVIDRPPDHSPTAKSANLDNRPIVKREGGRLPTAPLRKQTERPPVKTDGRVKTEPAMQPKISVPKKDAERLPSRKEDSPKTRPNPIESKTDYERPQPKPVVAPEPKREPAPKVEPTKLEPPKHIKPQPPMPAPKQIERSGRPKEPARPPKNVEAPKGKERSKKVEAPPAPKSSDSETRRRPVDREQRLLSCRELIRHRNHGACCWKYTNSEQKNALARLSVA